jgi:Protein of unknown function (DUF4035)
VFRLALALGRPVREMLASMCSDELTEWMAYYQLEPFGDYRADYRSGVVASTFANAHRAKDANPFRPEDFMPFLEKKKPQEEIPLNVARFKAMFSHKVVKHG